MSSIELEPQDLPDVAHHNHGRTLAGWFTSAGLVLGGLLVTLGMSFIYHPLTWAGIVVAVVALVGGAVLRALGYGQPLK